MLSSVIPPGSFATSVFLLQRVVSNYRYYLPVRPQLRTDIRTNALERIRPFISQHSPRMPFVSHASPHLRRSIMGQDHASEVTYHPRQICLCLKFGASDVAACPSSHEGNEFRETLDHKLNSFFSLHPISDGRTTSRSSFGIHSPVRILSGSPFTTMSVLLTGFFITILLLT
jgi:hypothetical protein